MVTTSGMFITTLILATIGIRMIEATVCETKVATPMVKHRMSSRASQGWVSGKPERPQDTSLVIMEEGRESESFIGVSTHCWL